MLTRLLHLLAVAALAATAAPAGALEAPALPPGPQVGEMAPDIELPTADGKHFSLAALRGKTVVVNAWATWCPPCRLETPDLLAAYKTLAGKDVVFVGIDSTEIPSLVRAFVAAKGVPYQQAIDRDHAFSHAYDVKSIPSTFVIGPDGVLRARYIDVITPKLLASFVAGAKASQNAVIASAIQTKIDGMLAPAQYPLTGDPATVVASVGTIRKTIAAVDKMLDDTDPARGELVDVAKVQAEEVALRNAAIAALQPVATTSDQKMTLALLQGDAAWYGSDYTGALASYQAASALDPKNGDALGGISMAARRLQQYDRMLAADDTLAALDPSVDAYVSLGVDAGEAKQFARGAAAFDRAVTLASAKVASDPKPLNVRKLAWAHMYYARMWGKAGERAKASREYALAGATALRLPKNDVRYAMYLEQAQEGQIAEALGTTHGTTVSLSPWTGGDLPGSIPGTVKYRLVVAGRPGSNVTLRATDVPKTWVASFCTDRVCAPGRVAVLLPSSGVKVIEFQLVPPDAKALAHPPVVHVSANDGGRATTALNR